MTRPLRGSLFERKLLTTLSPRSRVVASTLEAAVFLDTYPELFYSVSSLARTQFVAAHTLIAMLEPGHEFGNGIFIEQGVAILRHLE